MINETNNAKIEKLMVEAGAAGDLVQVCICYMALGDAEDWAAVYALLTPPEKDRVASLTVNYDYTTAYRVCLRSCAC